MLIAIEGIDGSGKGSQGAQLLERTRNLGYTSELVSFPRYKDTHCSKMVAAYLNGEFGTLEEVPPVFAATLFALDRLESRAHIERACKENDLVIVDRYVASNLAYQSARITNPERARFTEWLFNLEYEIYDLPKPDLTLFLEMPAHTSKELVARKEARTYTEDVYDLHERDSTYLSSVREVYHALIASRIIDPCLIIDCQDRHGTLRAMDDIGQEVCDAVVQYKNSDAGGV